MSPRIARSFALVLGCIFQLGSSPVHGADVTDLNGKVISGKIAAMTADTLTVTDTTGSTIKLPLKSLALIDLGTKPETLPANYDELELTDGSVLRISEFKLKGKDVLAAAATAPPNGVAKPELKVPLLASFAWLRGAPLGTNRNDFRTIVAKRGNRDLLITRQKQDERDVLVPSEGTVKQGSEDGSTIDYTDSSDASRTLPIARFAGLVFNQPSQAIVPPTAGKVIDVFGNTLVATKIDATVADGKFSIKVKTVSGAEVAYDSLDAISKFDFSQGNQKYLAEFEPTVDAPPVVEGDLNMPFLRNKSPNGGLRLAGKGYTKGMWINSDTALVYKLDGEFREFKAVLGIDEAVPVATGTLKVSIEADGKKLFEQTFTRKANKPETVNLNVKDAKSLRINVEADSLFTGASLSLGDARLQK